MIDIGRIVRRFRLHRRLVRGMIWADECTVAELFELDRMAVDGLVVPTYLDGALSAYDYAYRWAGVDE